MLYKTKQKANDFECGIGLVDLKNLLSYDPDTGLFIWRITRSGGQAYAGDVAGHVSVHGYVAIRAKGRLFWAHRLAWLFYHGVWPSGEMDHINRVKTDNRIENLRVADPSQNGHNTLTPRKRKRKAPRGVTVLYKGERVYYYASILINRKRVSLGRFSTAEEAGKAYKKASILLLGEFSPYHEDEDAN